MAMIGVTPVSKRRLTRVVQLGFWFLLLTILGCGGGGGSDGHTNDGLQQGTFIDGPVTGLRYLCNGLEGKTDTEGHFQCDESAVVRFFVGDILLGETITKSVVTPVDLIVDARNELNAAVTNIARFLQTIDDDGDPSNGIWIRDSVHSAAVGRSVFFLQDSIAFESDQNVQDVTRALTTATTAGRRELISGLAAQDHLRVSLLSLPLSDPAGVRFTSIWSEQFGNLGRETNFLPGGAGIVGNQSNYVLMGAGQVGRPFDDRGYLGATLELGSQVSSQGWLFRLAEVSADSPGVVTRTVPLTDGDGYSVTTQLTAQGHLDIAVVTPPLNFDIRDRYYLVAGRDSDGDGELDLTREVSAITPGRFIIESKLGYDLGFNELKTGAFLAQFPGLELFPGVLPIASEFLETFLDDTHNLDQGILQVPMPNLDQINWVPSHKVGVIFRQAPGAPVGPIRHYTLRSDSDVAFAIARSRAVQDAIRDTVKSHEAEIQGPAIHSWPLCEQPPESEACVNQLTFNIREDQDLGFAMHGTATSLNLTLQTLCQGTQLVAGSALIQGDVRDLFDFDFNDLATRIPATVEAGYGTIGRAGSIFFTTVEIDHVVAQMPVDLFTESVCQIPDISGSYFGQHITVNSRQCIDSQDDGLFTFPEATLEIDSQDSNRWTGVLTLEANVDGFHLETTERLNGTVNISGTLEGSFDDQFTVDGIFVSGGSGSFAGQWNGQSISLSFEGRDTIGDTCAYNTSGLFAKR